MNPPKLKIQDQILKNLSLRFDDKYTCRHMKMLTGLEYTKYRITLISTIPAKSRFILLNTITKKLKKRGRKTNIKHHESQWGIPQLLAQSHLPRSHHHRGGPLILLPDYPLSLQQKLAAYAEYVEHQYHERLTASRARGKFRGHRKVVVDRQIASARTTTRPPHSRAIYV